jgi:hypothetical protein
MVGSENEEIIRMDLRILDSVDVRSRVLYTTDTGMCYVARYGSGNAEIILIQANRGCGRSPRRRRLCLPVSSQRMILLYNISELR